MARANGDTAQLSGPAQVGVLKRLNQQAAAYALGISARALRDRPDAPRATDGTYDAHQLVRWWKGRRQEVELSDDEYERILLAVERVEWPCYAVQRLLRELLDTYGEAGLTAFAAHLLDHWDDLYGDARDSPEPTPTELRQRADGIVRREQERAALDALHFVIECGRCRKLRRGRQWIKAQAPAGFVVWQGRCPRCAGSRSSRTGRGGLNVRQSFA